MGKRRLQPYRRRQLHGIERLTAGLAFRWRRLRSNPFDPARGRAQIVHASHHKCATMWMARTYNGIALEYSLDVDVPQIAGPARFGADIVRRPADDFVPSQHPRDFRGSHLIRDPRDVIVSGYFYHLWTEERWVHVPHRQLSGRTYQEHLKSVPQDEGLLAEINFVPEGRSAPSIAAMARWNYADPRFIELLYEELMAEPEEQFRRLFRHLGFKPEAVERGVEIGMRHSFERRAKRAVGEVEERSHERSGKSGQWRELFDERHKAAFKAVHGDMVPLLGYEPDNNW